MPEQTLKAQLLYLSYFEVGEMTDFGEYARYFSIREDDVLLAALNNAYGLDIDGEAFGNTYLMVKNATIDPYLFGNPDTKNGDDLVAWCRNAYESKWLCAPGGRGEMDTEKRRRTVDNRGLILGYLQYLQEEKAFESAVDTFIYRIC
jgi:hypothetical protein